MKLKKFSIYLLIYVSIFIVFSPVIFSGWQHFNKIFYVLNYEEKAKDLNFKDKNVFKEKFRQDFLKTTKDVFSTIGLEEGEKFPVFFKKEGSQFKKHSFFGEWLNDSFFVYLKNGDGFENSFERFKKIKNRDLIIFNFFGICKKFAVKEVKLIANCEQVEEFTNGVLTVLLDLPCNFNSFKLLIRADFLENISYEKSDFFSLFFKDLFFIILSVFLIFLFLLSIFRIIVLLKKRKKNIKIKYIKGALYFN